MLQVFNDFSLLSRDASVDANENMLSIFKIIERFNFTISAAEFKKYEEATSQKGSAASFPVSCFLSSSWSLEAPSKKDEELSLTIKVLGPDSVALGELNHKGIIKQGNDKVGFSGPLDTLPVTKSGQYTLHHVLSHNEKVVSEGFCRFKVFISKEPSPVG